MTEIKQIFDPEVFKPKVIKIYNKSTKSKAKSSLPDQLMIKKINERYSVLAKCLLAKATQFGPLEAPLVTINELEENNFQIKLNIEKCNRLENADKSYIYYDTSDENMCNWMMFVQSAKSYSEQNLCAHQVEDFIYYTTVRDISPDEELKVWYSPSYAKFLSVSVLTPSSGHVSVPKVVSIKSQTRKPKTSIRMQVYLDSMITERDVRSVPPKKRRWRRTKDNRRIDESNADNKFYTYSSYGTSRRVVRKTFVKIPKTHDCCVCAKKFKTKHKLRIHSVIHSNVRKFLCHYCGGTFKRQDKLHDHIVNLHSSEGERKIRKKKKTVNLDEYLFKCTECEKGFQRRGMFVNHLIKMHPDMQTSSVTELSYPIYKPVRDFLCPYCEKVYKSSTKRKLHIEKLHPGKELPMSLRRKKDCPILTNESNMNIVMRDSIISAPVCCPYCTRQYSSKHKMNKHAKEKHPEMLDNCNMSQTQQGNLYNATTESNVLPNMMRYNVQNTGADSTISNITAQSQSYLSDVRQIYEIGHMPPNGVPLQTQQAYNQQCQTRAYDNGLNSSDQDLLKTLQIDVDPIPTPHAQQNFTTLQSSHSNYTTTNNHQHFIDQHSYTDVPTEPPKEKAYSRYPQARKQIILKSYQDSQNNIQTAPKLQHNPGKQMPYKERLLSSEASWRHASWQHNPNAHCNTNSVIELPGSNVNPNNYGTEHSNQPSLISMLDSVSNETGGTLSNVRVITESVLNDSEVLNPSFYYFE